MTLRQTIRFLAAMRLHPTYVLWGLAATVACAAWTIMTGPAELDSALGMVLFLQMFLASTGFVSRARRGHFDQVLLGRGGHVRTVVAHWVVSIAPGLVAWVAVSIFAWAIGSPTSPSALIGSRAAAFVIVSALSWAVGFGLPRGAAGMVWIAGLLAALLSHAPVIASLTELPSSPFTGVVALLMAVLCPFALLGSAVPFTSALLAAAVGTAAVPLVVLWRRAADLDLPLVESAQ